MGRFSLGRYDIDDERRNNMRRDTLDRLEKRRIERESRRLCRVVIQSPIDDKKTSFVP